MELTDNDRQRIEQAAKLSWKNTITAFEDSDEISFWEGYLTGAEYCTLYERQQQAALKELNRTLYESNERQAVVISEFKQEGSSERARANNAVGKYWETLQANKKLEAERSELIEKMTELLKAFNDSDKNYADWVATKELYAAFTGVNNLLERLNSLKK